MNSVISLYYYLRVAFVMYVSEGPSEPMKIDPQAAIALVVTVAGVFVLGIYPEAAMVAAARAAAALFGG